MPLLSLFGAAGAAGADEAGGVEGGGDDDVVDELEDAGGVDESLEHADPSTASSRMPIIATIRFITHLFGSSTRGVPGRTHNKRNSTRTILNLMT